MAIREPTLGQFKHLGPARKRSVLGVAVCTFVLVFAATELWSRAQHARLRRPARPKARSLEAEHYGETVRAHRCLPRSCSALCHAHRTAPCSSARLQVLGCVVDICIEVNSLGSLNHACQRIAHQCPPSSIVQRAGLRVLQQGQSPDMLLCVMCRAACRFQMT